MLILSNEEIESLLTMDLALKSLERAYIGQAQGTAVNRPRSDLYLPGIREGSAYAFKTMEGGLTESKIVALRLNSDTIRWQERENRVVKDKLPTAPGKKWVGLIQLFSAETGEPLAMFPDGVIQRMRVAADGGKLNAESDIHSGRSNDQQIIYYKSNTGVGIQFAATGALIYEECKQRGLGRELPSEWFGADLSEWMDKGFMPSP